MAVFRVIKTRDYTVMSNHHFRNKNLSIKAKGLLSTMLALPDDWDFTERGLTELSKDCRNGIRTALKELEDNGYLVRNRNRNELGRLTDTTYDVYEEPMSEKPTLEKPTLEKSTKLNTNINKILNNKKDDDDKENKIPLLEYVEQCLGITINSAEANVILTWEDNDLTRYAIEQAGINRARNTKYISRILQTYKRDGITKVEEAKRIDEDFKNKPTYKPKQNKFQKRDDAIKNIMKRLEEQEKENELKRNNEVNQTNNDY